jgi:hypothetical protein
MMIFLLNDRVKLFYTIGTSPLNSIRKQKKNFKAKEKKYFTANKNIYNFQPGEIMQVLLLIIEVNKAYIEYYMVQSVGINVTVF